MESASASWIGSRVADIHSKRPETTVAVVLTKEEIKNGAGIEFLGHLPKSKDFRQDLNLTNAYWFYTSDTLRRCLLLKYNGGTNAKQELRNLGVKAA